MVVIIAMTAMSVCAFAEGNVAGAIEGTWKSASGQIKQVVNNVVFPIIDLILTRILSVNCTLCVLMKCDTSTALSISRVR